MIARSLTTPPAFSTIFDRHYGAVYAYLARRAGRAMAEDLAASTFTVAFERRRNFKPDADSARPWLLGIATNLVRNQWRSERRGLELVARLARTHRAPEEPGGALGEQVAPLLAGLEPGQRDVLLLYAWEDLSYEEIASALGLPVGTVRSRLARARANLRRGLESEQPRDPARREASG